METIDFNTVIEENISVVGELIGTVTPQKDGLVSKSSHLVVRGEKTSVDDFNNLLDEGRYYLRKVSKDTPNSPGHVYAIFDVSKTNTDQYTQISYPTDGSTTKVRFRSRTSTGNWTSWVDM